MTLSGAFLFPSSLAFLVLQTLRCVTSHLHADISLWPIFDFLWLMEPNRFMGTTSDLFQVHSSLQARHYLQSLNDIPVVSGSRQNRVSASRIAGGQSPVHRSFLYNVVGLQEEVVDLAVQVHRNSDGPALGYIEER